MLHHPQLAERLKLCQPSLDLPGRWECGRHDRDLLVGAAHGVSRTDYHILNDPAPSWTRTRASPRPVGLAAPRPEPSGPGPDPRCHPSCPRSEDKGQLRPRPERPPRSSEGKEEEEAEVAARTRGRTARRSRGWEEWEPRGVGGRVDSGAQVHF